MIFLILTIAAHSLVMFAMRFTEANSGNRYAATVATYVVGAVIAFFMMDEYTLIRTEPRAVYTLLMAAYNGVCMTMGMILCRLSMGKNGTPISTTFNRLGVLIPTVFSILLFGERPQIVQITGIALAVSAIIYINSGKETKSQNHIKSMKLLIAIFLVGGLIDLNTKIFERYGDTELNDYYIFMTFVFCVLVSLVIMLKEDRKFSGKDVLIGAFTGVPNTFILYFSLKAVEHLPAYIVFPAYSAGVILVVNVVNYFLFKENLSKQEKISTVMVAAALILINI